MKNMRGIIRKIGVWTFFGGSLASLTGPAQAHDRPHLSIGIGIPLPVEVAPAPVIVVPKPVVIERDIIVIKERPVVFRRHHGSGTWKKFRSGSGKKFWRIY